MERRAAARAKPIFDALIRAAEGLSRSITDGLNNGSMARGLALLVTTTLAAGALAWATGALGPVTRPMLPVTPVALIGWFMLVVSTGVMVTVHRERLLALVLIAIVGLIVSVGFAYLLSLIHI